MPKKEEHDYFIMMQEMVACTCQAAEKLHEILTAFDPSKLDASLVEMHAIEHRGDDLKHALVEKLVKEFITPLEREDIMAITNQIDDVTDAVEDVLLKIYMFNVKTIQSQAIEFADIITQCCKELYAVFCAFADFKKAKTIHPSIIEINRLEEVGDTLYINAVHALYSTGTDPITALAWTEVYARLEKCCDTCENAADLVEHVIMKNT